MEVRGSSSENDFYWYSFMLRSFFIWGDRLRTTLCELKSKHIYLMDNQLKPSACTFSQTPIQKWFENVFFSGLGISKCLDSSKLKKN